MKNLILYFMRKYTTFGLAHSPGLHDVRWDGTKGLVFLPNTDAHTSRKERLAEKSVLVWIRCRISFSPLLTVTSTLPENKVSGLRTTVIENFQTTVADSHINNKVL